MKSIETRWPCPVCLGVKLEKLEIGSDELVLDHCPRCGGMWFELGEVQALGRKGPEALRGRVDERDDVHRAQCHSCGAFLARDDDRCPACGARNRLNCPMCTRRMKQVEHEGMVLDVCSHDRGVWFDHHELNAIWTLERDRLVEKYQSQGKVARVAKDGSDVLLETLIWAPDLAFYGAIAAGEVASAAVEAAPAVLETVGEAAGSVFSAIVEIIGGIFG